MAGDLPVQAYVTVDSTVLWRTPQSPREIDSPMVADRPDHAGWLDAMDRHPIEDADGRTGLLDRIETELTHGEPVHVHRTEGDWSQVTCPWQPNVGNADGYPGWVRSAHLAIGQTPQTDPSPEPVQASAQAFLDAARGYLGLRYLWGGNTEAGLDCSGLVHHVARGFGHLLPRDGGDQYDAAVDVPVDEVRPGDLYFFAHPGKEIHHVGIVVEKGIMLHAPESGAHVVEEALDERRTATLVSAARILA